MIPDRLRLQRSCLGCGRTVLPPFVKALGIQVPVCPDCEGRVSPTALEDAIRAMLA